MVCFYKMSAAGTAHVQRNIVCQDASQVLYLDNGWVVAAVADGVGSCKYADVASSLAVETAVSYCTAKINAMSEPDLHGSECISVIKEAFIEAESAVEKKSLADGNLITEYDTTLSLIIYDGIHAAYGHCGDGGVIGLTVKGDYQKITEPQKAEGIYVIPLRAGITAWEFGTVEEELASILLATDGVYDIFFPYLLKGRLVEIYVPLIRYFMDNNGLMATPETIDKIGAEREEFINSESCAAITDDKTLIVLINDGIRPEYKEEAYYAEPDWDSLQMDWNKKVYPHLYQDDSDIGEQKNN